MKVSTKVPFLDKRVRQVFYGVFSQLGFMIATVFLFIDIEAQRKVAVGAAVLASLVILYIGIWVYSNHRQYIKLIINTSEVEVKSGDIFSGQADLKVIAFNEYFDTLVDDKIIAGSTLNGIFINKYFKGKVDELDRIISSSADLGKSKIGENMNRPFGKKIRYKLGTVCVVNDYLITAFTRFDDNNIAYLEITDYITFLLNFWSEVDRVYAGKTVALPVLGSGITRLRGYEIVSDQELVELILWTFKVSRIKFTYPSKVRIVVHPDKYDKINLMQLRDLES